jgi:hypothetical protein
MSIPKSILEPQIKYLYQLLAQIESGELLVPKFQRDFLWTDEQRLDLLRSIKSKIPIGSFLIWRTKQYQFATFDLIGGLPVAKSPELNPRYPRDYLLDGQQRLSTLFATLKRPLKTVSKTEIITFKALVRICYDLEDEDNIVDDIDWRIFYDLEAEDFLLQRHQTPKPTWIPVSLFLNSFGPRAFSRVLKHEELKVRASQLSKIFTDYTVMPVYLESNDLQQATTAFQRLNNVCTPKGELEMAVALNWNERFFLTEKIADVQEKIAEASWTKLDEKLILSACRVSLEWEFCEIYPDEIIKELKEDPETFDDVADSFIQVAQFLQTCGIYTPQMLPYSYQSVLLAEAFRTNPSPNNAVLKALSTWLWRTAYTEDLSGLNDANMQRALEEILSLANGEVYPASNLKEKIAPLPKRFNFNASRAKLLALRLAELKPQAINGELLPVGELLGLQGKNAILRLLPNLSSPENCFIVEPKAFFQFRDYLLKTEAKTWENDFLRSHAISDAAAQALKLHSYDQFLSERRQTLIELEKSFIQPLGLDYDLGSTAD